MSERPQTASPSIYRTVPVNECSLRVMTGHDRIAAEILENVRGRSKALVVCEGFVGARWDVWRERLSASFRACGIEPAWFDCSGALKDADAEHDAILQFHLTDEPVFGRIYRGKIGDFFDAQKMSDLAGSARQTPGISIIYGPGASLAAGAGDCLVYLDVSKEEFQNRCRGKSTTSFACREARPLGEMYKRAFYIDWPVLNLEKRRLLPSLDLLVDETDPLLPKACHGVSFRKALAQVAGAPVRVKPFFLPGPWGGQWMKENFELPSGPPNYAWSYELIAPENGILVGTEQEWMEVSFDYLLWQEADAVMGPAVTSVFGSAFPIRFDYLDTVGGTNLSCQIHPRVDYIRDEFGEPFTQHETYYVMQAELGARVYLGLREDIDPAAFRKAAEGAEREGTPFEIGDHVHSIPSSAHDLFLIPAGTVHCSGAGNLVLEISATPYIYTFKIYDYLRKDLTGQLRQVFVDRAFANIDFTRRAPWVNDHLKPAPRLIREDAGAAEYVIADLPQLFFRIHRLEFEHQISDACNGRFLVLNLVAGERVEILHGSRRTELRYAETIIVPASVGEFQVVNKGQGSCKLVKALIR